MTDHKADIVSQVQEAFHSKQPQCITAGNSKNFYGRKIQGTELSLINHAGITEYEPSELYIKARSGTPLSEIEKIIAAEKQMLPFEPPHFGPTATFGGMTATGLSGPRRVSHGAVRDCILGVEIINGKGEVLQFGGKVMKNVAGYDVSRLMCGAMGTLGVLTSITVRLNPMPVCEKTIAISTNCQEAILKMNELARKPIPITATFYDGSELYIRISGSLSTIDKCTEMIGGDEIDKADLFWTNVREHTHEFFFTELPLWRISVPSSTDILNIEGVYVMEWNGALRWYATDANADAIRDEADRAGGHACLFRGIDRKDVFHPLAHATRLINLKLKQTFDPAGILNPGKIYAEI